MTPVPEMENLLGSLSLLDLGFSPQGLMRDLKSAQDLKTFMENEVLSKSRVTAIFVSPTTTSTIMRTITEASQYEYHVLNTKNSIRLVVKDAYALFRLFHRMFMYEHFVYPQMYLKRSTLVRCHCACDNLDPFGGKFGTHLPWPSRADDEEELDDDIDAYIRPLEGADSEDEETNDEHVIRGGTSEVVDLANGDDVRASIVVDLSLLNDDHENEKGLNVVDLTMLSDSSASSPDDVRETVEPSPECEWSLHDETPAKSVKIIGLVPGIIDGEGYKKGYAIVSMKKKYLVKNPNLVANPEMPLKGQLPYENIWVGNWEDEELNDWTAKQLIIGQKFKKCGVLQCWEGDDNRAPSGSISSGCKGLRYAVSMRKDDIHSFVGNEGDSYREDMYDITGWDYSNSGIKVRTRIDEIHNEEPNEKEDASDHAEGAEDDEVGVVTQDKRSINPDAVSGREDDKLGYFLADGRWVEHMWKWGEEPTGKNPKGQGENGVRKADAAQTMHLNREEPKSKGENSDSQETFNQKLKVRIEHEEEEMTSEIKNTAAQEIGGADTTGKENGKLKEVTGETVLETSTGKENDTFTKQHEKHTTQLYHVWDEKKDVALPTGKYKEVWDENSVKPYILEDLMSEEKNSIHKLCRIAHINRKLTTGQLHPVAYWIELFTEAFDRAATTHDNEESTRLRTFASRLCKTDPRVIFDNHTWKNSLLIGRQDTIAWTAARQILGDVWKAEAGTKGPKQMKESCTETIPAKIDVTTKRTTNKTTLKQNNTWKNTADTNEREKVSTIHTRVPSEEKKKKIPTTDERKRKHDNTDYEEAKDKTDTSTVINKENSRGNTKEMSTEKKPIPRKKTRKNPVSGDTKVESKTQSKDTITKRNQMTTKGPKKKKNNQVVTEPISRELNQETRTQWDLAQSWGREFMKPKMTPYFGIESLRLDKWKLPKNLMDVVGDGNCLFYCMLFHLFRTNRLTGTWEETEPLQWMRKTIRDAYHRLTDDDCMNATFYRKADIVEGNRNRVFKEGIEYKKVCSKEDYGEPIDCLVYAKLFGMRVVVYNACINAYMTTIIYDGRRQDTCAGMDETCNALVEAHDGVLSVPNSTHEGTLQLVNYRTDDPDEKEKTGTGSEHYVMVNWNCRACENKTDPQIWFENEGCQSWCDKKLLCTQCATHVNTMKGKTIFCGSCGCWRDNWMERYECGDDCSKKRVCQECAVDATTSTGRRTRSTKKPCIECGVPGSYLLPKPRDEYECNNCKGYGRYTRTSC